MNKNVFYYYFEHLGMGMGGCECAALDDAAAPSILGRYHQIWPPWPGCMLLGSVFHSKKHDYVY